MKRIIVTIITLLLMGVSSSVYAECEYYDLMLDCKKKNESGIAHAASDYLCVTSENDEEILYNIILDKKFSVVDKKVDDYMKWLYESKNYYFGVEKKSSFFQGVDIIGLKFGRFGEYWQEYNKICDVSRKDSVLLETLACIEAVEGGIVRTGMQDALTVFEGSTCIQLAEKNLYIHESVAYDIMKVNKAAIRRDNRKRFMQNQRDKYENLLNLMRVNVGYMERIWKKWPSKTKDAH